MSKLTAAAILVLLLGSVALTAAQKDNSNKNLDASSGSSHGGGGGSDKKSSMAKGKTSNSELLADYAGADSVFMHAIDYYQLNKVVDTKFVTVLVPTDDALQTCLDDTLPNYYWANAVVHAHTLKGVTTDFNDQTYPSLPYMDWSSKITIDESDGNGSFFGTDASGGNFTITDCKQLSKTLAVCTVDSVLLPPKVYCNEDELIADNGLDYVSALLNGTGSGGGSPTAAMAKGGEAQGNTSNHYTVFVPTEDSLKEFLDALDPSTPLDELEMVVYDYHTARGTYPVKFPPGRTVLPTDLSTLALNPNLTVTLKGPMTVIDQNDDHYKVVDPYNLLTPGGVVHCIDGVLLPGTVEPDSGSGGSGTSSVHGGSAGYKAYSKVMAYMKAMVAKPAAGGATVAAKKTGA